MNGDRCEGGHVFDHLLWRSRFRKATQGPRPDRDAIRRLRVAVIEDTLQLLGTRERKYFCGAAALGNEASLDDAPEGVCAVPAARSGGGDPKSVKFSSQQFRGRPAPAKLGGGSGAGRRQSVIEVIGGDCLEVCAMVCREMTDPGVPLVLNMASHRRPGGGYMNGAGAQEENLFRRSDLSELMPRSMYPLEIDEAVYTPSGHVFRGAESRGYPLVPTETYAFVACAAFARPELVEVRGPGGKKQMRIAPEKARLTADKVRLIFEIAAAHGHRVLILSALGCGAFRNPPRHVAEIFRDVLSEGRFANVFERVVFAIFDDHNTGAVDGEGNLASFQSVFG